MKLIPDPGYPARYTELVELVLKDEGSPRAGRGWAAQLLGDGLNGLLIGKTEIAMRCLRVASKHLVPPIEKAKSQAYTPNIVVSGERTIDKKSGVAVVSQVVQLGFTAFTDGYIWRGNGLAHWLLDAADDTQSFRIAVELLWQHFSAHPEEFREGMALDSLSPILFDVGMFDECIRCVSGGKYFSEPKSPGAVRAPRTMAYVLSRHCKEGWWTPEQVQRAMETMLKVNVPKWTHGHWEQLAHWMKIAFWNEQRDTVKPVDALRKCFDYLPEADRPERE